MMLTAPAALWLLAVVPAVWLARRFTRTNFNRRQQVLQTVVRSLALALLVFALARPVVSLGSTRLSIVYVVDISYSVSSRAIVRAADRIDAMNAEVRPAHWRLVVFGSNVAVVRTTEALRALAKADLVSGQDSVIDREGSDLERALGEARAEIAAGHVPRIVLFSDGRPTIGSVDAVLARLAHEGVPVFVEPAAVRELGDAWIEDVRFPAALPAGGLVAATVEVGSQRAAPALVEIAEGGRVLASRPVSLVAGTATVTVDVAFDQPGPHVLETALRVDADPLAVNNVLSREVVVSPRARVLYIEGAPASARYLQGALERAGFEVRVDPPAAVPVTRDALDPWDVVILSDLSRAAIPDASMAALAEWVEKGGGGLLVAGGESVFGEGGTGGGYRRTELERLTPVTFERKDEPEVALVIVLDRSWSMAGQVMELCKSAAQAAIEVMADEQTVGVITFNDGFNWDVTLRNVGKNRAAIRKTIAAIEPAGHTLIYPAVEQAFLALKDARARAKHVVLLSDGRSYPDDYEGLVRKMVDAKMTVSSISVGPAADVELLTNIAKWGRGRSYVVEDAREVPQIFVKEAKNATTPAFDEKDLKAVVKTRGFLEGVDVAAAPALRGRTATVMKDNALELLTTKDNEPLLAFWPIGAGRTAVFASDVKDRWASDWLRWRGYGPFFAAVVRALQRRRPPSVVVSVDEGPVRAGARPLAVAIEARDPRGAYRDLQSPVVHVETAALGSTAGAKADVPTHQVAPGRYEAAVVADARRRVTVSVAGVPAELASRVIVPDTAAEYRFRAPDEALLRSIAAATGGAWTPSADALQNAAGTRPTARRALWPLLVVLALGLWFVDIVLRRVRLFEPRAV